MLFHGVRWPWCCTRAPGKSCSHHQSPGALDVDWNPIRKYKGARALECGSPGPRVQAGATSTSKIGRCSWRVQCARLTGGTHGRTTGTLILLISIRFPLENKEGWDAPKDTPFIDSHSAAAAQTQRPRPRRDSKATRLTPRSRSPRCLRRQDPRWRPG